LASIVSREWAWVTGLAPNDFVKEEIVKVFELYIFPSFILWSGSISSFSWHYWSQYSYNCWGYFNTFLYD
jgi:hypothetical protein